MKLSERLNEDMKALMKSGDKFALSVVRMVRSAVKNAEIDARRDLTDDEVMDILTRETKQRRDALQEFEKAGREDLAEQAKAELEIIQRYMPQPLTDEELDQLVQETISAVGATSKADMGKVMSALMPKVKGRADGKQVNAAVQRLLV
ncbi:GatB/YqeY domain-containing protein [Paenibacillus sp.]|uniref:GatB/YqeY domain-containing protein n=1 Tax=Paenibacillus sp. TaxID=58172 RepID=UPI002D36433C|nr:GatB/YqeY domain-containing protein [Paenibacillus sp.]HZG84693.1 GatB/YqeY domain-containing protein [Paenibacillus sp.]